MKNNKKMNGKYNELLMRFAEDYSENVIVDDASVDVKNIVRDAYYDGFSDVIKNVVYPMFEKMNDSHNVLCGAASLILEDVIRISGEKELLKDYHFYVSKDGRTVSDFDNRKDAVTYAYSIGGEISKEEIKQ